MQRPIEYDNLLKLGAFKIAASSPESIDQFLATAAEMQAASAPSMPDSARFFLAYEGCSTLSWPFSNFTRSGLGMRVDIV